MRRDARDNSEIARDEKERRTETDNGNLSKAVVVGTVNAVTQTARPLMHDLNE